MEAKDGSWKSRMYTHAQRRALQGVATGSAGSIKMAVIVVFLIACIGNPFLALRLSLQVRQVRAIVYYMSKFAFKRPIGGCADND